MQHWRVPFLGLQAIPPELTDFEIRYFFSYTAKERAAIFSRYGDQHRLAVALQIGMLKMTGRTLDAFETVSPAVLRHLQTTRQIPTPELTSLRALYQRRSTLHDHQAWAIQLLDFRPLTERRQRALMRQVRHEALKAFTLNHLVEFAKRWLYERRMLIPADRRVRDLARTAYADTEHALLDAVRREIPAEVLQTWQDALFAPRQGQASALEWLQQAPRRTFQGLKEQLDKIHFLKALHPTFKGAECPCCVFGLRALHTTRSRGRGRHRSAGDGVGHQRAARPLAHRSIIGPALLV